MKKHGRWSFLSGIRGLWERINNPIEQDRWAVIYTRFRGTLYPLCPVFDPSDKNRIVGWELPPEANGPKLTERVTKQKKNILSAISSWWGRINNPVCQDISALLYAEHNGVPVPKRPVVSWRNITQVEEWIPDPIMVDLANRRISPNSSGSSTSPSNGANTGSRKPDAEVVPKECLICVDGSNVICMDENLRTKVLQAITTALNDAGYRSKVFVDRTIFGWLRNKAHDEAGADYLSDCEKKGLIFAAPGKAEADGQILQLAKFENAHVITNDLYRDYAKMHPWLNDGNSPRRLHGINIVPMGNGVSRILIAGFNLDITVRS